MNFDRLTTALERFAHIPTLAASRVSLPASVERVSRLPVSWTAPPKPERLTYVSLTIANWLNRRGPAPTRDVLDDAPLLIAAGTTTFLSDARFQAALSKHVDLEGRPRALTRLIDAYFRSDGDAASVLGPLIERNVGRHKDVAEFDAPSRAGLFNPASLPRRLALRILESDGDPDQALLELGEEMSALSCRFARRLCEALPEQLAYTVIADQRFDARCFATAMARLEERYPSILPAGFPAFVRNVLDGAEAASSPLHQRRAYELACAVLGNPIDHPEAWSTFETDLQRKWLTWSPRRVLELAFDLTRETDELAAWKSRFWLGLIEAGTIDQATLIVVGPLAEKLAGPGIPSALSRLASTAQRSSIYPSAIVIMRAGPLTIGEWAPSGSCRIWLERNVAKPQLGMASYDIWEMRQTSDFEQAHRGSPKGVWQNDLLTYMRKTGLKVPDASKLL